MIRCLYNRILLFSTISYSYLVVLYLLLHGNEDPGATRDLTSVHCSLRVLLHVLSTAYLPSPIPSILSFSFFLSSFIPPSFYLSLRPAFLPSFPPSPSSALPSSLPLSFLLFPSFLPYLSPSCLYPPSFLPPFLTLSTRYYL